MAAGPTISANDRIQLGMIGMGGRGADLARAFNSFGQKTGACKIVAIADVWTKRKNAEAKRHNCNGYLDYREIVGRKDIDAIAIATPDHWHTRMALEGMDAGKDVYLETPMCRTIDEAKQLAATVRETGRVLQIGSQNTSADQWHQAKRCIAQGAIGKMVMSQGEYHRRLDAGEQNLPAVSQAGPDGKGEDFIDWKAWLGPAPKLSWNAERFLNFRRYSDYSDGIAADPLFHLVAALNICWGESEFPRRVSAIGAISELGREQHGQATFDVIADFPAGHSLVVSSSAERAAHVPILLRGNKATIAMVEDARNQNAGLMRLLPEGSVTVPESQTTSGWEQKAIRFEKNDALDAHIANFLDCVRSRQQPRSNVDAALRTQVIINMATESYRKGRILYWDESTLKVTSHAQKG